MEFRQVKCAKATFIKGNFTCATTIELDIDTTVRELEQDET